VVTATHGSPLAAVGSGNDSRVTSADADNLFLVARVVEEKLVAFFHFAEMAARGEITHAGPCLALGSALDLVIPGILIRLGLQQPVRHVTIPI
jgi:hypothetical protein